MEIWQAIVLGLVQGLTEFLPVSSSGHLVFLQRIFGLDGGLFIPIILHLGTLTAVCAVFYREIAALFRRPFKTLGYLVLVSVPAALAGFLLEDRIDELFYKSRYVGILLAVFFLITAATLFVTEIVVKRRASHLPLCMKTVLPMAFAQAVAILPGISRSGSTICAGALSGANSEDTAKFSFLMSVPVILGGFVISLIKGLIGGEIRQTFSEGGAAFGLGVAIGFVVSAISGLFAIRLMLKAIKRADYKWFSLYLAALAAVCIILHCTNCF